MFQALGPGSEGPQGPPGVPGDSHSSPRACGVDQISRASRAHARCPAGSTRRPRRLRPGSEGPRCHTALLGHSRFGPTDRGVDQLTRATLPCVQRPLGSTDFPGRLRPVPEGPWYGPPLPGDSSSGPRSRSLPAFPGDLGMCQMSRGVDQLSRGTQARVQDPVVSTSCPGELYPGPKTSRIHQLPRATRTRV